MECWNYLCKLETLGIENPIEFEKEWKGKAIQNNIKKDSNLIVGALSCKFKKSERVK